MEEPSRLNMARWCVPEVADLPEALFLVTDPESGWEFMSEFPTRPLSDAMREK